MTQNQGAGQAAATSAERVAQAALETAEQALQEAQQQAPAAQAGSARVSDVTVTKGVDGYVISVAGAEGGVREIILSRDGSAITRVDGISTIAIAPPAPRKRDLPDNLIPLMFIICGMVAITTILGPIMKALGRRMEKRDATVPNEVMQRLAGIEQAVDTVAIEVERISEGQRFTSKLLAERGTVEVER
jgi:hypothetical protein